MAVGKLARLGGLFLLNCVVAVVVTGVLTSEFRIRFDRAAIGTHLLRKDLIDALAAFLLGYFVYRRWRWRSASAKWVWLAGLCWFAQRVLLLWFEEQKQSSVLYPSLYSGRSVFSEMSGLDCAFAVASCADWSVYTLPLIRTACYSAGAFACLWLGKHESDALPNLKKALLSLRR